MSLIMKRQIKALTSLIAPVQLWIMQQIDFISLNQLFRLAVITITHVQHNAAIHLVVTPQLSLSILPLILVLKDIVCMTVGLQTIIVTMTIVVAIPSQTQ